MGVDCVIILPPSTRVADVADVIGKLLGQPHQMVSLYTNAYYCNVEGVTSEGIKSIPQCAHIIIQTTDKVYQFLYHFEFRERGNRGLLLRSTPLNVAIGRRLIDFFGGQTTYQDHTDEPDYSQPVAYPDGMPDDGVPWQDLQDKIAGVVPITPEEVNAAKQWAEYDKHGK